MRRRKNNRSNARINQKAGPPDLIGSDVLRILFANQTGKTPANEEDAIMAKVKSKGKYRFSFGPWNIDEGADPFGPAVRRPEALAKKIKTAKKLGFEP